MYNPRTQKYAYTTIVFRRDKEPTLQQLSLIIFGKNLKAVKAKLNKALKLLESYTKEGYQFDKARFYMNNYIRDAETLVTRGLYV